MMYDIYLSMGGRALPDLNDLMRAVPALAEPQMQQKIVQRSPKPGFLGLDLTSDQAKTLMQRLKAQKAVGYPVPSAYRQPKITIEQATPIATQAIEQLHKAHIPEHTLGPVLLRKDEPACWTFGAVSEEWVKEGRIPGVLFASVDKLDGHVWKAEEFEQLRNG